MMRWQFISALVVMLGASAIAFGQTSYQGLLPGKSTRSDVEKVLGKPVQGTTLVEYSGRENAEKVFVQYDEGATALRIELILSQATPRSEMIRNMKLPQEASAAKKNAKDRLEEYFRCPACIVYTYGGPNVEDGITRVAYYSSQLYESAQERPGEAVDTKKIAAAANAGKGPTGSGTSSGTTSTGSTAVTGAPSGPPLTAEIPSIRAHVTSFRFFEGDALTPTPSGLRQYKNEFVRADARAIYYELNIMYDDTDRPASFTVTALWRKGATAEPFARQDLQTNKPAGWATSSRAYGYGQAEPGKWEPGTYSVEIQIGGAKVAFASFVIN